jgi:hypothetical protein
MSGTVLRDNCDRDVSRWGCRVKGGDCLVLFISDSFGDEKELILVVK